MSKHNLQQLAELLAAAVGIEQKDTVEDTIEAAIEKLNDKKATKPLAKQVKKDVKDELKEQLADLYVSNITPPFWDRVRMKYLGMPDLKSWAELDKLNKQALQCDNECSEDTDVVATDDISGEAILSWDEIVAFLSGLSTDEYMHTCYDDDEWEYVDDDEQEKLLATCDYCDCDDDELEEKLDESQQLMTTKITADELVEALTLQQRLKKAMKMRSKARMIALKRKIALKRHATPEKLKDRARRLAIRMMKTKYSGGKAYNDLSYNEREHIEKMIMNKKSILDTLTRKLIPVVRRIEQQRFSKSSTDKFNRDDFVKI